MIATSIKLMIRVQRFGLVKNLVFVSCQNVEVRKTYYESGKLKSTVNYVYGLKQGEWKYYYESGELQYTANYVDGAMQGEYK